MKNVLFTSLLLLVFVFTGCQKDETTPILDRDKFIGLYNGTQSSVFVSGTTSSVNTTSVKRMVSNGNSDNEIVFDKGLTNYFYATVNGSSINIYSQSFPLDMGNGTSVNTTILGSGSLSTTGTLTISYTLKGIVSGKQFVFTMNEILTK